MAGFVTLRSVLRTALAGVCLAGVLTMALALPALAQDNAEAQPAGAPAPGADAGSGGAPAPIVPVGAPSMDQLPALPSPLLDQLDAPITVPAPDPVLAQLPCLCAKALGASTCKDDRGFNLVAKRGRTYLFSAFYGADDTAFYCQVTDDRMVLSAQPWGKKRLTATYEAEPETACVKATVGLTLCDTRETVRCCRAKAELSTATSSAATQ